MEYALGIDGGGTKTCFLLADAEGNIIVRQHKIIIFYRLVQHMGIVSRKIITALISSYKSLMKF